MARPVLSSEISGWGVKKTQGKTAVRRAEVVDKLSPIGYPNHP